MPLVEDVKKLAELITGRGRPDKLLLSTLLHTRKPHSFRFRDDNLIPNHPKWGHPLSHADSSDGRR